MTVRNSVSAMAFIVATLAQGAQLQAQNIEPQGAAEQDEGSPIIVTGTRRTDRTVAESAVPIDVFDERALASQPSGDMNEVMRNLVPSFNVGRYAIADGSTFVRPPTLRGLPPDETLVLVNGKRRHRSALVQLGGGALAAGSQGPDLAQIPTSAIARIEVLRDGAAAQYGSDAIAGVINYTLKRNSEGIELTARYGQYYEGDGEDVQISGNIGLPLGPEGFFNISGEYLNSKQTDRGVQRPDGLALEQMGYDIKQPAQIYGNPEVEAYRVFINAAVPFGSDELYFFGNYGKSDQAGDFNYRRPISVTTETAIGGNASTGVFGKSVNTTYLDTIRAVDPRTGSPTFGQVIEFYDFNGRTWETSEFFPNGFTPRFMGEVSDLSAVLGYKGTFEFGLNYDLSASYGQSRIKYTMGDTVNPSLGPDSTTFFYMGKLEQQETNFNLDLSYPIEIGAASPLNIAAGAEYRRETYIIGLGDTPSWAVGPYAYQEVYNATTNSVTIVTHAVGSNGFPGYGPDSVVDSSRSSYAGYLDFEVDLTEAFTIGVAGRYEHFSDFGDTWNGKVAARYALSPAIAFRGAASTGFRAPTPGQLFTRNVATTFTAGSPTPIAQATIPATDPAAAYYGAEPLQPEKSVNLSGGIVLTPVPRLTVTADYFNIRVKDRIGISGVFQVLGDTAGEERQALLALGVPDWASLGQVVYFSNGFTTRTQGVDIVASYAMPTDIGTFNSSLAISYVATKVTDRKTTVLERNTIPDRTALFIDDVRKGDIEHLNPKWRGNFTQTYTSGPLQVTGRASYFGTYTDYSTASFTGIAPNQDFGTQWIFDLEVAYTIADRYTIAVGAQNLFDSYPDKDLRGVYPSTGGLSTGRVYMDDSPAGWNGGFWYARLNAKF